jgi:hypothetical protein
LWKGGSVASAKSVECERELASPELGGGVSGRVGDAAARPEEDGDVFVGDVWAELAGALCSFDQLAQEGRDASACLGDQVLVAEVDRDDLGEATVAGLERNRLLEERAEPHPGIGLAEGQPGDAGELVEVRFEDRLDERRLMREAPVEGAHAHTGSPRDLLDRGFEAVFGEGVGGGAEDALAVCLRVAAESPGPLFGYGVHAPLMVR